MTVQQADRFPFQISGKHPGFRIFQSLSGYLDFPGLFCIPEYLLWMDDLSGFSNFEPYAALLRKESSTWLADITSDDYASVSVDQPAIAVAEALARKDAGVCYVLDGDKLAGVVTLPHFLNKVFRD